MPRSDNVCAPSIADKLPTGRSTLSPSGTESTHVELETESGATHGATNRRGSQGAPDDGIEIASFHFAKVRRFVKV
jgi:hypothetical protein